MDSIYDKVKEFIFLFVSNQNTRDDDDLFVSGSVNSLFTMQLILFIEKEYNISVTNNDLNIKNFNTIRHITQYIEHKTTI